jgi:hypothetical protein
VVFGEVTLEYSDAVLEVLYYSIKAVAGLSECVVCSVERENERTEKERFDLFDVLFFL